MSVRIHYWYYLTNTEGQAVANATVRVYLAETDTLASYYKVESGGIAITDPIITERNGFFEFWIEDIDYEKGQKFKITWSGPGITTGSIDNIDFVTDADKAKIFTSDSIIFPDDWIEEDDSYCHNCQHNLGNFYPFVICYDYDTGLSVSITVERYEENIIKIWSDSPPSKSVITVIG